MTTGADAASTAGETETVPNDYFVERNGERFAALHLLVDLWGAEGLDDQALIKNTLREAAKAARATELHVHLHQFSENGGISGVLVLAESHISIHTWPERGFAAIDVLMCGDCDPEATPEVFETAFNCDRILVNEQRRGRQP